MNYDKKTEIISALKAWENSKASDAQLDKAIDAVDMTITTLLALGGNWVVTMGLQTSLTSMTSARDSRRRDRLSQSPHVSQPK